MCVNKYILVPKCPVQNVRPQESRGVLGGSVSIPSISKARPEPGRSMSASSGLGTRKFHIRKNTKMHPEKENN